MSSVRLRFPAALWSQRDLLWQLSKRSIEGRYRGSMLGWTWSFATPLLMLAVYTFVFSEVFQARWGDLNELGPLGFAINLFAGLIVFNIFAEVANQSADLILNNKNLVTKVVFPLPILSATVLISALFHACTSLVVLMVFELASGNGVPVSIVLLPLTWLPAIGGFLALSWVLSALGVYLRDLGQVISVATNLLMFLSAVFYPLSALPERWQPLLQLNPLVVVIEQTRRVAVDGQLPSFGYVFSGSLIAVIGCELAFRCFQRASRGFADVL